ncbi:hypothetical protein [Variovorax sp. EBFNA2]|uniref:hypothetical protein n=1 Tax=Variovorax sp. EBFNA2 TaxID=3342097 RepID=UPI0029C02692|nr:hypothetical protein [Variovorax boronicumulans]WPG40895.1 hypothetical protein RZE79_32865 [Variovorax boronicumulans]
MPLLEEGLKELAPLASRSLRMLGRIGGRGLMAIKAAGLPARHHACMRMKYSRPSAHSVRLREVTMKKVISLCLRILGRRGPVRRHDEEIDLLQRLREAGL